MHERRKQIFILILPPPATLVSGGHHSPTHAPADWQFLKEQAHTRGTISVIWASYSTQGRWWVDGRLASWLPPCVHLVRKLADPLCTAI
jgi:hypothetical protein